LAQLLGSVMTFSCPSFFASATSALKPPQFTAEVQVEKSVLLAVPLPLALVPGELEELELQPAASKIEPTAAAVATIALDARKVNPPMSPPGNRGERWHLG
jgi:hypothetical protein